MDPRGVVDLRSSNSSSCPGLLDLRSCGGEGQGEVFLRHAEGGARVADGDGHELHLAPDGLEGGDKGGFLHSLLLFSLVASKVPAESDLDDNEVALLAVKVVRVRHWAVWYSSGVDEVGAVPYPALWRESWVSSGRIQYGMRDGASVHSESVFGLVSYLGSCETFVCL